MGIASKTKNDIYGKVRWITIYGNPVKINKKNVTSKDKDRAK